MNQLFLAIILCIGAYFSIQAQEINNKNYYQYYNELAGTNWLRTSDAIPIIIDELIKNDVGYHTISVGTLLEINDSTQLVLSVSFSNDKSTCGFVFEEGHSMPVDFEERNYMYNGKNVSYYQRKWVDGNFSDQKITNFPENIFLLKETCYWYQYDSRGKNYPVSREAAELILRQDIKYLLKKL